MKEKVKYGINLIQTIQTITKIRSKSVGRRSGGEWMKTNQNSRFLSQRGKYGLQAGCRSIRFCISIPLLSTYPLSSVDIYP